VPADVSGLRGDVGAGHDAEDPREPARAYDGLVCMSTLTAPGQDAGLVWDRANCTHGPSERCGKAFGCKVLPAAAALWNGKSRAWWRELNHRSKTRADRAVTRLGHTYKGGVLLYEWELQARGVWHLHFVLGMERAVERAWAFEYVKAMRALAPSIGFGFVDAKPLHSPQPAEKVSSYLSKYLAKWNQDGTFEVTETVKTAGRSLLSYVSRKLTAKSGCTMRVLRQVRIAWAWREGFLPDDVLDPFDLIVALCFLEQHTAPRRGP
jgi:hypothetical protein